MEFKTISQYPTTDLTKNFIEADEWPKRFKYFFCFNKIPYFMDENSDVKIEGEGEEERTQEIEEIITYPPQFPETQSEESCSVWSIEMNRITEMVINRKVDPNGTSATGVSLMAMAAASNDLTLLKTLIEHGANVNYHGVKQDYTPIMEAVLNGNKEAVEILIKAGANLSVVSKRKFSIINIAAYQGFLDILKILVENGAPFYIDYDSPNEFYSPFLEAIAKGNYDCFIYLAEKFPEKLFQENHVFYVNNYKQYKTTSLTLACTKGNLELINYIHHLKKANNKIVWEEYTLAFEEAALSGNLEAAKLIQCFGFDFNDPNKFMNYPLSIVASLGHLDFVKYLIENGMQVNYQNFEGVSPLMEACREGFLEVAEELIKNKANLNLYTKTTCESAISFAASMGHLEVVKLLIENGIKINPLTNVALIEAARNNQIIIIQYLLSIGVSVNVVSPYQQETPLAVACDYGYNELIKFLLSQGANINATYLDEFTPLMRASKYGNFEIVKLFIDHGCNVSQKLNSNEHTALSLACLYGHLRVAKILIEAGANLDEEYADDVSLTMYASRSGNSELFEYIYKIINDLEYKKSLNKSNIQLVDINLQKNELNIKTDDNIEKNINIEQNDQNELNHQLKQEKPVDKPSDFIKSIKDFLNTPTNSPKMTCTETKNINNSDLTPVIKTQNKYVDLTTKTKSTNETVLMIAVSQGNYDLVASIIEKGGDVNQKDRVNMTPLMISSFHGFSSIVKLLIAKGAKVNEVCNSKKYNALHYAILNQKFEIIKILVDAKINLENEAVDGTTPLTLAASLCSLDIIRYLVDKGAKINPKKSGPNPLSFSTTNPNFPAIMKYLVKKGADPLIEYGQKNFLHQMVLEGRVEQFKILVDKNYINELKNINGTILLNECILGNKTEMAVELIRCGIDVNAITNHLAKLSPLMIAVERGNIEIIAQLLKRKAAVDYKNRRGDTALKIACALGDARAAELLLRYNATVDEKDVRQESAVLAALRGGHVEIVRMLAERIRKYPTPDEIHLILTNTKQFKETHESIKECLQILMEVKAKKEAQCQKSAEILIKEISNEPKKKEEQNVKKSASQKKRDKKKKKKVVKQPEPQEIKQETPSPSSPISPVSVAYRIEKPPKPPKLKPPLKVPDKIPPPPPPPPDPPSNVMESDNDEWEVFTRKPNNKSDTAIRTMRSKIPSRLVGRVIGKSGSSIKELRDRTNTSIDVDTSGKSLNEDCDVTIRGNIRDVRTVIDFITEVINNPDRSNNVILEELESKKPLDPSTFIVPNFKNRQNHSNIKYDNTHRDNYIPSSQPISNDHDVLPDTPKRIQPIRQTVKIEEIPKITPIKTYDTKPKLANIPPPPIIPASNVKWSVEPELPIRNITTITETTGRSTLTLPQSTISQPRNVNLCPGAGRPLPKQPDIKDIKCPIWDALHDPSLNVGFQFDEELWKTTSFQSQPFSQTVIDLVKEFKTSLGSTNLVNISNKIPNPPTPTRPNIPTRTWFDSTTPNM